jgi:predicted double-glycine peptidase
MNGEIGRVVFRLRGGTVEVVLDAAGDWVAPPKLKDFLRVSCPVGNHRPGDGPWGWDQLRRAAELLGGTAVPRHWPGASDTDRDAQAEPPDPVGGAEFNTIQVPAGAVRIDAPELHQEDGYSCGAVMLEAFARYFEVAPDDNKTDVREWFKAQLGTTKADGTPPKRMEALAQKLGLCPVVRHPMTREEFCGFVDAGRPVICCIQAWGEPDTYAKDESGHYVGGIGYDDQNVYFEDPMIRRGRGYMSWPQFLERWHDKDGDGNPYRCWGMALWRPEDPAHEIP